MLIFPKSDLAILHQITRYLHTFGTHVFFNSFSYLQPHSFPDSWEVTEVLWLILTIYTGNYGHPVFKLQTCISL